MKVRISVRFETLWFFGNRKEQPDHPRIWQAETMGITIRDSQFERTRPASRAAYNLGEDEPRVLLGKIHAPGHLHITSNTTAHKQKGTPGFEPGTC